MSDYNYLPTKQRVIFSAPWTAGYAAGWLAQKFGAASANKPTHRQQMDQSKSLENAGATLGGAGAMVVFGAVVDTIVPVAAIGTTVADGMGKATGERFGAVKAGFRQGRGL